MGTFGEISQVQYNIEKFLRLEISPKLTHNIGYKKQNCGDILLIDAVLLVMSYGHCRKQDANRRKPNKRKVSEEKLDKYF